MIRFTTNKPLLWLGFQSLMVIGLMAAVVGCASQSTGDLPKKTAEKNWYYCGPSNQNIRSRTWDCGDVRRAPVDVVLEPKPQSSPQPLNQTSRVIPTEPNLVSSKYVSTVAPKPKNIETVDKASVRETPKQLTKTFSGASSKEAAKATTRQSSYGEQSTWLVQLAAFQNRAKAERFLVDHDQISNLKIKEVFVAGAQWYRVLAYSGASQDEASAIAQDISLQYPAIKPWLRKAQ